MFNLCTLNLIGSVVIHRYKISLTNNQTFNVRLSLVVSSLVRFRSGIEPCNGLRPTTCICLL